MSCNNFLTMILRCLVLCHHSPPCNQCHPFIADRQAAVQVQTLKRNTSRSNRRATASMVWGMHFVTVGEEKNLNRGIPRRATQWYGFLLQLGILFYFMFLTVGLYMYLKLLYEYHHPTPCVYIGRYGRIYRIDKSQCGERHKPGC